MSGERAPARDLDLLAAVRKAAEYSEIHHGTSFLAIQNGKTLLEKYPGEGGEDTPRRLSRVAAPIA